MHTISLSVQIKPEDRWTKILDERGCIDVAYCDFVKTFDKVPNRRLLHKLQMYGIGENYILTQPQTESISQRGIFRVEICNLWKDPS